MAVLATGQLTVIDYNDSVTLSGFLSSNVAKTQIFNPDTNTYIPNWAASPYAVVTPSLFVLGTSDDIVASGTLVTRIQSIKWFDASAPTTELTNGSTYGLATTGLKTSLTIKQNLLSANTTSKDFLCEIIYRDPSTGLDLVHKMSISFSRVTSGGGLSTAIAMTPNGNIFKNGSITSLKATVDLWRGSTIDNTQLEYQWYIQNGTADEGAGTGWQKLTSTTNYGITGYTTREITVPASAVPNLEVFKVSIKDIDTQSSTYLSVFWETVTFVDQSDPIQVTIVSSGGTVFKNGSGSSVLTAKVFQAGAEIDTTSPYKYKYTWRKYLKDATLDPNFGGAGVNFKTGKTLSIGDADVDVKATFSVDIEPAS